MCCALADNAASEKNTVVLKLKVACRKSKGVAIDGSDKGASYWVGSWYWKTLGWQQWECWLSLNSCLQIEVLNSLMALVSDSFIHDTCALGFDILSAPCCVTSCFNRRIIQAFYGSPCRARSPAYLVSKIS